MIMVEDAEMLSNGSNERFAFVKANTPFGTVAAMIEDLKERSKASESAKAFSYSFME